MPQNFISRLTGNNLNISIVGMTGSGKSAIAVKYLTKRFITEYAPFASEKLTKTDQVDGQDYHLTINDCADTENLDIISLLQWSNVVLVIFSITSRRSFYRAQELVDTIHSATAMVSLGNLTRGNSFGKSSIISSDNHDSPFSTSNRINATGSLKKSQANNIVTTQVILVSHKTDLERFRLVKKEEIQNLASEFGIKIYESTVTEDYHIIQEMFHNAIRVWNSKSSTPCIQTMKLSKVPPSRNSPQPEQQRKAEITQKKTSSPSLPLDTTSNGNSQNFILDNSSSLESTPINFTTSIFSNLKLKPSLLLNSISSPKENNLNEAHNTCEDSIAEPTSPTDGKMNQQKSLPPAIPKKTSSINRFKFFKSK